MTKLDHGATGVGLPRLVLVIALALSAPALLGCGINDILGRKPKPTVPAALLGTMPATAAASSQTSAPAAPIATAAGVSAATPAPEAPPATQPAETTYTVQSGDTLGAIATQFGVSVEAIVAANNLSDPNALKIGQVLTIPAPGAEPTQSAGSLPTVAAATPAQAGGAAAYSQAVPLDAIGTWLTTLGSTVATLAMNPTALCSGQAEPVAALQLQGQGLLGDLGGVTPPAEIAGQQQQLSGQLQAINQSLADAKTAICDKNDSPAAIASLLQVGIAVGQAEATVAEIDQFITQGMSQ